MYKKIQLFLDLGNSRLKIGKLFYFKEERKIWQEYFLDVKNIEKNYKTFTNSLESLNLFEGKELFEKEIIISSVKPELNLWLEKYFSSKKFKVIFFDLTKQKLIDAKYLNLSEKEKMGSDIVANAYFASNYYKQAIIVSLGTITVISKIEANKIIGTIFCPGLKISQNSIFNSTSQLSNFKLNFTGKKIGQSTEESLSIGLLNGHIHMINGLIKEINQNKKFTVLITGGNYFSLKPLLKEYTYIDNMVLKGLMLFKEKEIDKN